MLSLYLIDIKYFLSKKFNIIVITKYAIETIVTGPINFLFFLKA